MEPEQESRLPNLMDLGVIKSNMNMSQDTETLDAVVINQNFCRFVLSNKGFLHSYSRITFSVDNGVLGTFPVNTGIYALIDRCSLRIGTEEISTFEGLNSYMGYKSQFIDNAINVERETYLTSRIINHDFIYDNASGAGSNINASGYGLSTAMEYTQEADGVQGDLAAQPELRFGNKSTFSVSLADLFPWLRYNQLPLYMITDQVSIELHFAPSVDLTRGVAQEAEASGTQININEAEVQFVADYIYYDGDTMEAWREQNKEINWTYVDYRLNKRTFTGEQLNLKNTIDIGGAGRIVNKVVTSLQQSEAQNDKRLTNIYSSKAPRILDVVNNQYFTTNLIYNDNRLYPIDRKNSALHFNDVAQAENNIPHITRQEFSGEGGAIGGLTSDYRYMGYEQSEVEKGLNSKFHYTAYKLNRNERVNSRGIQLELQYGSFLDATVFTHRAWLELTKRATLSNGKFKCYLD